MHRLENTPSQIVWTFRGEPERVLAIRKMGEELAWVIMPDPIGGAYYVTSIESVTSSATGMASLITEVVFTQLIVVKSATSKKW